MRLLRYGVVLLLLTGMSWAQNQLPPGTQLPDGESKLLPAATPDRDAAESRIEQRDFAGARPLLEKELASHPTDARALFDLGYVEDAAGHEDSAAADYRKAIAADPKQFEARLALGLLLAHQAKFELAKEQILLATRLAPPNPAAQAQALRTLAELDRSSDPAAARDALVAALRLSPQVPTDLLLTAQIAQASGDPESAQTAYQRLLTETPGASPELKSQATSGLAQLLIQQKKYADAEPLLKSAVARDPRDPALNAQLATALLAQQKTAEALPILETLEQLQPGDNAVDQMLADAYSQAGQPIKADPIYARMVAAHPGNEQILVSQGENLVRERRYFEAQQVLEKAVKLKADDGDAWSGLAFAASENKDYPITLHALSMRANLLGETPVSYFLWATTYDSLHQLAQAREYYRKFLAVANGKFPDQEWQAKHRLVALGGSH